MEMLTKQIQTYMIRWRLRVLMAEKNINNKTLAELTGIHPTSVSRLKNTDELKQISGEVLNALCNALECTPNDLIEFTPDKAPDYNASIIDVNYSPMSQKNRFSGNKDDRGFQERKDSQAVA